MIIKDEHFRNYYKKPIVIKDKEFAHEMARTLQIDSIMEDDLTGEDIKERLESIEIDENINSMLVFPYVDHTAGISFRILTTSTVDNANVEIHKREDFSVMLNCRKDKIDDLEFEYLEKLNANDDFDLSDYNELIERIDYAYRVNDDVELLRSLEILDGNRDDTFPDDVLVYFLKEGFGVEGMWVRYERIVEEHFIEGTLLNTPDQDLGVEMGDKVKIFHYRPNEDAEWALICDLNNTEFIIKDSDD